ncbi:MAG: RpiB/LacA/LacB family sugar-phosphate isomerase [Patescibacteria group bacterium]
MKVFIGADHRGFPLKESLKPWLVSLKYDVVDCGNDHLDLTDDFPDFSFAVADNVSKNSFARPGLAKLNSAGIVICGSGAGVVIAANKVAGIRAALAYSPEEITRNRQHDDVNVLALAADWTDEAKAKDIVTAFLTTAFLGEEKYVRRIEKIKARERH